jgi:glycine/D-amino acid oxidase-like deaminating enzyme
LIERGGRVVGARVGDGEQRADVVVVCSGAWTTALVPWLDGALAAVGQPAFHLAPERAADYAEDRLPVFGADIARTGFYGFPADRHGIVKIANHGIGIAVDPTQPMRAVTAEQRSALRAFLRESVPGLAAARIVFQRLCVYGDSADGSFWIAGDPERPGLVAAAGGSGHAFKFAPLLGDWIADAVEGRPDPLHGRFAWRSARGASPREASRHQRPSPE